MTLPSQSAGRTPRTDAFAFTRLTGPAQTARYPRVQEWMEFTRTLERENSALKGQRDELVAFAQQVRDWYENSGNSDPDWKSAGSIELWHAAKSLLAKLKQGD